MLGRFGGEGLDSSWWIWIRAIDLSGDPAVWVGWLFGGDGCLIHWVGRGTVEVRSRTILAPVDPAPTLAGTKQTDKGENSWPTAGISNCRREESIRERQREHCVRIRGERRRALGLGAAESTLSGRRNLCSYRIIITFDREGTNRDKAGKSGVHWIGKCPHGRSVKSRWSLVGSSRARSSPSSLQTKMVRIQSLR